MLVTLEQASDHLRRDTADDDADLTLKIHAASNAIINYLKRSYLAYVYDLDSSGNIIYDSAGYPVIAIDSAGEPIAKPEVQQAVLLMLGVFYIDRDGKSYVDGDGQPRLGNMSLPPAVHWILDPLRKPTLA